MKRIILAPQLEQSLLSAILHGMAAPSLLTVEELSKDGKVVLKSIHHLLKHGARSPLKSSAVLIIATRIFGGGQSETRRFLKSLEKVNIEVDAQIILNAVHSKEALVNIINEASGQLSQGEFDRSRLTSLVGKETWAIGQLRSVADGLGDKFPEPPRGIPLPSLPTISEATNGFSGLWILGGEPGVGKSTLAWQLVIELSEKLPVYFYDLDGTGLDYFIAQTEVIFGGSMRKVKRVMKKVYFKEDLVQLDNDLNLLKPPALIVVDSMQTVPVNITHRRNSLDKWIVEFKQIAKRGYPMLIVSEVPRGSYENVTLSGYKETGALEYAGSVCVRMMGDIEDAEEPIQFHLMKNKHYKKHGHIINLERVEGKDYWFEEARI